MTFEAFYEILISYELSPEFARAATEILVRDDLAKEDFGRTESDNQTIAIVWLFINEIERSRRNKWVKISKRLIGNGDNHQLTLLM